MEDKTNKQCNIGSWRNHRFIKYTFKDKYIERKISWPKCKVGQIYKKCLVPFLTWAFKFTWFACMCVCVCVIKTIRLRAALLTSPSQWTESRAWHRRAWGADFILWQLESQQSELWMKISAVLVLMSIEAAMVSISCNCLIDLFIDLD